MAESSAWMRAELDPQAEPTRKRNGRGTLLFAISTTFAPSSSVILVSTLTTPEISQIAKATMVETTVTMQKATMIHEEGRTARPPRVLTDERG
jgi:hypothetical protein